MRWFTLVLLVAAINVPTAWSQEADKAAAKPKDGDPPKASPDKTGKPEPSKTKNADPGNDTDKPAAPKLRKVFDTTYTPAVGDRAVLYCRDERGEEEFAIWASKTPDVFREYAKAHLMSADKRMDELEKEGTAVILDEETQITITGLEEFTIFAGDRVGIGVCARIQVLGGRDKGKVFYTPVQHIARVSYVSDSNLTGTGDRRPRKKKVAAKKIESKTVETSKPSAVDPAVRAANLLKLGQNLEKSGKTSGALDLYRQIVKAYPKSPQAKDAAARIEALGPK